MPRVPPAASALSSSPGFARHKSEVLRTLVMICESLRGLHSEPEARRACTEVAEVLRAELKSMRRDVRDIS